MTAGNLRLHHSGYTIWYVSLGLDDRDFYILVGIAFALLYGVRPLFYKMKRQKDM